MKNFYLLPIRVSLVLCLLFSSIYLSGQKQTATTLLNATSSKIDVNRIKSQDLQKGKAIGSDKKQSISALSLLDLNKNNVDTPVKSDLSSTDFKNTQISDRAVNSAKRILGAKSKDQLQNNIDVYQKTNAEAVARVDDKSISPLQLMAGKEEDLSKRDASSKHFKNADGSYTAIIGSEPMHFQKNGKWEDIDLKVTKTISGNYAYANTMNLMESYFGGSSNQGILSKTKEGEIKEFLNTKMYWEVNGKEIGLINGADVHVKVDGGKVLYPNLFGNIDAEYEVLKGKRKLNYIIPDKKALGEIPADAEYLVFSEDIELPFGWKHTVTERGISIKNNFGKEIFLYVNPVSIDSSNGSIEEKNTSFETQLSGSILHIKTKISTLWLLDSARNYPIMVDPTVNVWGNITGAVQSNGNYINYTGQEWDLISGYLNTFLTHGVVQYDISSIPAGSAITGATSYFRVMTNSTIPSNRNGHALVGVGVDIYTTPPLDIWNDYNQGTTAPVYWSQSKYTAAGNINQTLNAAAITAIQTAAFTGRFAMRLAPIGTDWYNNEFLRLYGERGNTTPSTGQNHRPYLTIVYTAPTCFVPTNLNVNTITSTSAQLTWTAASPVPSNGYELYISTVPTPPTAATPPTGTTLAGITTKVVTGLPSNTVHHFWVRSNCNSSKSVWVYGGYFNTNPAQNCFQGDGQVRGNVENGLGVQMSDTFRVADDFIVPAGQGFTLSTISLESISSNPITNVTINIRADNSGSPGAIINTVWNNAAPTSSTQYTSAFSRNVNHLIFNLPSSYNYTPGKYWMEVTMTNSNNSVVFWRATSAGSTGALSQNSGNSGTSWVPNANGYNMMFYVGGTCVTCNPVTAESKIICAGNTVALNVNSPISGYTYNWYINWDEVTQTGTLIGTGSTINVTPAQSTVYRVVGQSSTCSGYALVTVAISPGPDVVVATPVSAITCSNELAKLDITGGAIPATILSEDFTPVKHSWTVSTTTYGGAGPQYAAWAGYTLGGNGFAMADSNDYGPYQMETSLISEPMSFQDYSTVTLEFDHYFRQYLAASTGYVEISKDGGLTWSNITTFNSTRGTSFTNWQTESYNLNSYAGQAFVQIRFRYLANNAWYWAVNAVRVKGTPLSTTVTWLPFNGLFTDMVGTPYTGGNTTTVYASPAVTTTYTASAKTSVGCPSVVSVTVERGDKDWSGSNQNWNTGSNWSGGTIPTADHCVIIPSTIQKPIIALGTDAFAKNLTIQSGGGLTINGGLTVTDFVKNNGAAADVVIASDASLKQITDNPLSPNSGSVTAKRNITLSAERQQYNYVISPLENQSLASIYQDGSGTLVPVPFVLYHSEATNKFYTSSGAYIKGRALAVKEPATAFAPGIMSATFGGSLTNGAFTFGIVNSDVSNVNQGFNLTGNPYPSNIDLRKLYDINGGKTDPTQVTSPNISATFYLWDNTGNVIFSQQGSGYGGQSYALFNVLTGSNGSGTNAGSGSKVPTKIVKVGQGFMTRSLLANYDLNFNNSIRTTATSPIDFFGKGEPTVQDDRYWLKMTAPSGLTSTIAVVHYPAGNNLFGAEDSRSMGGSDVIYSMAEEEKLAINGRSSMLTTDIIPLGTRHFADGEYVIGIDAAEGIFANGQPIYLKDKQTGIITNLSQGSYIFAAIAGESTGRFEIIYQPETVLSTDSNSKEAFVVYRDGNEFVVRSSGQNITDLQLFDASGRLILQRTGTQKEVRFPAQQLSEGMFVIKATLKSGAIVTRKIRK